MKKNQYSFPLIYKTLWNISQVKGFTKLDIVVVFYKIGIAKNDKGKTVFRTQYELYEGLIIPFEFTNTLSIFQKYINGALQKYLDEFCSVYIDDILIYSNESLGQYREYVEKVLNRLHNTDLQLDIDKCEFEVQSTKYLGFIIEAGKDICIDSEKVSVILNGQVLTTVKEVQRFLSFANFYGQFIDGFSECIQSLTELMHKNKMFQWTSEADKVFESLKKTFMLASVLVYFNYNKSTRIETDSSEYCISNTL